MDLGIKSHLQTDYINIQNHSVYRTSRKKLELVMNLDEGPDDLNLIGD